MAESDEVVGTMVPLGVAELAEIVARLKLKGATVLLGVLVVVLFKLNEKLG